MAKSDIFVGRKKELEEFAQVLEDKRGQAILVVGQSGMGKTLLVNEIVKRAEKKILSEKTKGLKVWGIRYEIMPDAVATSTMERVIMDASILASPVKRRLGMTGKHREKWKALFGIGGVTPVFGPAIKAAGEAILSLCQSKERDTQRKFIEILKKLSEYMADTQRAIFVIDPDKWMPKDSDSTWKSVARELPAKIKLVFPQRPGDVLVSSRQFCGLKNVVRCEVEELDAGAIDELVSDYAVRTGRGANELHSAVARYNRHPYVVAAALALIEDGLAIEKLPTDPTPEKIVEEQMSWAFKKGPDAVKLFEAYSVLKVAVPNEVVEKVSGIPPATRKSLLEDNYLRGLLREEADGRRIYHSILADYVLEQVGEEERGYHRRAVEIYGGKLEKAKKEQTKPDGLAARRLAEHVLAAEGPRAFVDELIDKCGEALINLGLLDVAENSFLQALEIVEKDSEKEEMILGNLGLIYQIRGDLDKAEQMYHKVLKIEEKLGQPDSIAKVYVGLGVIYQMRGDLDRAEEMHQKSLEIAEKLGLQVMMASNYGNLGLIYRKRGELDKAEKMHLQSLDIEERMGRSKEMAGDYGNLGVIYQTQGDLDKAAKMYKKSLEIEKRLGHSEGIARQYSNLGVIYMIAIHQGGGDIGETEKLFREILEVHKHLGSKEGEANDYSNLGVIYQTQGDLDKAEKMYRKALGIYKKIGRREGMAINYSNLGAIYERRGELDKAEEMYKEALEIDKKIGRLEGMAVRYSNLGQLYEERGDLKKAKEFWVEARDLYAKIGVPGTVRKMQGWIEGIKRK